MVSCVRRTSIANLPFSVRARSNYDNKIEILNIDWQKKSKHELRHGDNLVTLEISNKVGNNIISASLSHIIPIFKGNKLHFDVFGKIDQSETHITLFIKEAQSSGDYGPRENYSGMLDYTIFNSDQRMDLSWIESRLGGIGGKMLVALYNTAKDLGIKKISFSPIDRSAEEIFEHLKFGKKTRKDPNLWTLCVK